MNTLPGSHHWHVPQGPNLWLWSRVAAVSFGISLVLYLGFTLIAGDGFKDSMGGDAGLSVLVVGFVLSLVAALFEHQS